MPKVVELLSSYFAGDGMSRVAMALAKELSKYYDTEIVCRKLPFGNQDVGNPKRLDFLDGIKYVSKADVVHTHFGWAIVQANLARQKSNVKHITTYHAIPSINSYSHGARFSHAKSLVFNKFAYSFGVDEFTAISKYTARELKEYYGKNSRLIYDGVDTKKFSMDKAAGSRYRKRHGVPEDAFVVGCVARFSRNKNQRFLISTLSRMDGRVHLLLGGAGPEQEACLRLAARLKVKDRVTFAGFVPEDDLVAFNNALDVCTYVSLWEGFGLPPLEANACGVPTIVLDKYSLPEFVRDNGFVVGSEADMAKKVAALMSDRKKLRRMGTSARKFALGFDWSIIAGKYRKLIDRLLETA